MKTIQLTDEQYNALMQGESVTIEPPKPKIEKWQPKGGEWSVKQNGKLLRCNSVTEFRIFGTEYQTEEQAEKARDAMRTHNRLLAWLAENDDGWVANWRDDDQGKYYVYSVHTPEGKVYRFNINWNDCGLGTVYMSKNNALKLCKLLNDRVVEL